MRTYKRKTERGNASSEVMELAAKRVMDNNESLRTVADSYDVSENTCFVHTN